MSNSFLAGVNRVMRINNIIRGDDDAITTFSDTQHSADIQKAQIAIQSEISSIISDRLIGYEKTSSTISLVTGTRTYVLASNFIRFYGSNPSFYDSTNNIRYYEYTGGEDTLRDYDYQYATTTGSPIWWYWVDTTSKTVGIYQLPSSSFNGLSLSYDYEKSVTVTNTTDTLPFITDEEYYAFADMAARRMKFLMTEQPLGELQKDATYKEAKSVLYSLMRPTNPTNFYGSRYG